MTTTMTAPTGPADGEPLRVPLRTAPHSRPVNLPAFRETLAFVRAKPAEMAWASIPWQTDLWEARRLALESGKPIFMWAMNGNPLGCV